MQPTPGVFNADLPHNLDFVAMQFRADQIGNLMQAVATASPPVTALLGPNEPNDFQQVRPLEDWMRRTNYIVRQ